MLGLRFCARAFSSCGERGPLFIAVRGPLTVAVSLVAEHRLQTRRLSSCGSRAQLLRGMWDLPSPGLEPVCPALAGRVSTAAPPGKPLLLLFDICISMKSNVDLFHLSVFFQISESGEHCPQYFLPPLSAPLSYLDPPPSSLTAHTWLLECPSISGTSVTVFDSSEAILLYAGAA